MDRTERFYLIDQLLRARGCLSMSALMEALGVSRATLLRDLTYLRDRLHAPIVYDRDSGGYRLGSEERYALPGLWFNPSEIHALLAMQQLLREIDPGLLSPHVSPLEQRLMALLGKGGFPSTEVIRRVRLVPVARRARRGAFFEVAATALLARRKLRVTHFNRNTGETTSRELSPLRLVYYRDNWYLDAWCHLRQDLRSFAVDALSEAVTLADPALEVDEARVTQRFDSGYGIFSHPDAELQWARLRFNAWRARWVEVEQWHPRQKLSPLPSGAIELEVPFSDPRELVGEILRYGKDCEVVAPASLRDVVQREVNAMAQAYANA